MDRWGLSLSAGWEGGVEDGTVCIARPDGVGALLISPTEKRGGTVNRAELTTLARGESPADAEIGECALGDFHGVHSMYVTDGVRYHRWYLAHGSLLLFVTYATALEHEGIEDEDVMGMLRTLRARGDVWE